MACMPARIVLEVSFKKPIGWRNPIGHAHVAAFPRAAARIELCNFLDQLEPAAGNARRCGVGRREFVARAEAVERPSLGEGPDLVARVGGLGEDGRVEEFGVVVPNRFRGGRIPNHAHRIGELAIAKEAGLPVAHAKTYLAVDAAIEMEEEEADVAEAGVLVNVNVVGERVTGARQASGEGKLATQHAVDPLIAIEEIDAQPGNQQQVGLSGFNQDAGGHMIFVQEPGIAAQIGFGPNRTGFHGTRFAFDSGDAVGEQHRRLRHAHLTAECVLTPEERSKKRGDQAGGMQIELLAAELRAGLRQGTRQGLGQDSDGRGRRSRQAAKDRTLRLGGLAKSLDVRVYGLAMPMAPMSAAIEPFPLARTATASRSSS
jgi:hypothetical protein